MCTFLRNLGIPVLAFVLLGLSAVGVSGQDASGTVTITQGGRGQGTVTSTPEGINCTLGFGEPTGPCDATFPAGTRVKLKAVAADTSKFVGWAPVPAARSPRASGSKPGTWSNASRSSSSQSRPPSCSRCPSRAPGR